MRPNIRYTRTFNCPFSGTSRLPGWTGTRKVKLIWILLKQETVSSRAISWAIYKSPACSRQITTPAPHDSIFLQAGCPSCHPTNSVKELIIIVILVPLVWNSMHLLALLYVFECRFSQNRSIRNNGQCRPDSKSLGVSLSLLQRRWFRPSFPCLCFLISNVTLVCRRRHYRLLHGLTVDT